MTLSNCILDNTKVDWLDACVITQKEEWLTLKDVKTDSNKICGVGNILASRLQALEENKLVEKIRPPGKQSKSVIQVNPKRN